MAIQDNIIKIRQRVYSACLKLNKNPEEIKIVAVSKGRSVGQIEEVIGCGILEIGENKVQEALLKYNRLQTLNSILPAVKWHMVGHLQTNKVKEAVKVFDLIHSVDSLRLAQEINKQAAKVNKVQNILLEVKTSSEATKFGLPPKEATSILKELSVFNNIKVLGLMTIAPIVDNPESARPYFRKLRQLQDEFSNFRISNLEFSILSMGMTDDFEIAIEEGANIVRIGRAIFGE